MRSIARVRLLAGLCCLWLLACATAPRPRAVDVDSDGGPTAGGPIDVDDEETVSPPTDGDQDGIPDGKDACPTAPEDVDGFEDGDGCPEPDNDGDRLLDVDDKCPNEPESVNGVADDDGCPDRGTTGPEVHRGLGPQIQKLQFLRGRSEVTPGSFSVLDSLAGFMAGAHRCPVEVQGHAAGDEQHALELGLRRAEAVKAGLVVRGVSEERLTARSYGSTRPLCREKTSACRARNRRVEFFISKRPDGDPCIP